jgi:spermidine/putrescine transport system permease protein
MVKTFKKIYIFALLLFLYAPIVVMAVYSFNASKTSKIWGGFTLKWYASLFANTQIFSALMYTLVIALVATAFSSALGTLAALGISGMRQRTKNIMLAVNYLCIINPDIIIGVSLMLVFAFMKLPFGLLTMFISHSVFCTPVVVMSVLPLIAKFDRHLLDAAYDLGAKPAYALRTIVLPQIRPGILTGALLSFTLSIDDFMVSFFTTGSGVTNLSIYVYTSARRGISPEVNALSVLMIFVVFTLLLIVNLRMRKTKKEFE